MKQCNDCVIINGKAVHIVGSIIFDAHTLSVSKSEVINAPRQ